MPSEYDFLSPYSRRLRRAGLAVIGVGAFLAGAVAMAAIVALPLFPLNGRDATPAPDRKTAAAAQEPGREPEKAVAVTATTPSTAPQAGDAGTRSLPEVPDTGAGRATTGLAGTNPPASSGTSPGAKPEATPLPASSPNGTSAITQSQPQVPAATGQKPKSEASVPRAGATTSSAAPANAEPPVRAADGSDASQSPKQKKPTASRTRRIQRERAAYRQRHEQRSTRAASSERRAGREYVDGNGVRYYVVPRSAESAFAYDDDVPRRRRVIIVRPGPFDDD